MNKKITKIIIILAIFIMLSPIVVSASPEVMTHIDDQQDVLDDELEMVNRSNIDILQISAIKNGKEVELKLKLVEGGVIQKSTIVNLYFYNIYLKTSNDEYGAFYTGLDLSSLSPEDLSSLSPEELEAAGALSFGVQDSQQEYIDVISCTGEGENELSIKFNIHDTYGNEKLIALSAYVYEQSTTAEFSDYYETTPLYPAVKSNYDSKVNTPLTFEATLEDGTSSDYNWLWVVDGSSIILEGQNPSYTFKAVDTYTGTLYVYDGEGSWGTDTFQVNVTTTNPNPTPNNEPGFELILVVAAVAIALILFRKKKK